jgi:short-subunit dehydrogenase
MPQNPKYPVALITGAASGIGRQLALILASEGTAVAALDLQVEGLQTLEQEIRNRQGRCAWVQGDVTDIPNLQKKINELETALGPIDLLIANAGVGLETSGLQYRAEDMNAVLGVNLLGVSNSIGAVLPGMLSRRRGHLVAMSSLASFRGLPRMLGYCASKAGVNALMEGLRLEVGNRGIDVTTICPGWIRTPMTDQIAGSLPGMLEADEAARRIVRAIYQKRHFYAFPASMVWQMRIFNCLPRFLRDPLLRKMLQGLHRKT